MRWMREERREREGKWGYKLTAGFDTKTKKSCERDRWAMY